MIKEAYWQTAKGILKAIIEKRPLISWRATCTYSDGSMSLANLQIKEKDRILIEISFNCSNGEVIQMRGKKNWHLSQSASLNDLLLEILFSVNQLPYITQSTSKS